MAAERVVSWLRRTRRESVFASAAWSLLALVAGVVIFLLTLLLVHVLIFWTASGGIRDWRSAKRWTYWLTGVLAVFAFIDSYRSSRQEINPPGRWLLREIFYIGPRLILSGVRHAFRILRLVRMDVDQCAEVLAYLALRNKSASKEELLRIFPRLVWSQLIDQLLLVDGVLFFRTDLSRVTLVWPLRQELRQYAARPAPVPPPPSSGPKPRPEPKPEPELEPEPEPEPVHDPDRLSYHEILGVSPTASLAEIKAAYRNRIKECHPDRFAGGTAETRRLAGEWSKALNLAYDALTKEQANQRRHQ